jgi:cysteine desulfurase family protein
MENRSLNPNGSDKTQLLNNHQNNGYFDNAATSFPKPKAVGDEILRYLNDIGGPYGRSFYGRALEVSGIVEDTRFLLAKKFGASADNIVFTPNATYAINTVLKGLRLGNKEILISPLEHNAVMRPLKALEMRHGVIIKQLPAFDDGYVNVDKIKDLLTGKTALVIINHQSNVNGVVQSVAEIKKAIEDIPILVDAAQSAGHVDLNMDRDNLDFVAFTGHKGLLGPTGTGGLFVKQHELLKPLVEGGTGSKSESFEIPEFMPDKFEAGTHNIAGIFGLFGALSANVECNYSREEFCQMVNEIKKIKEYSVICAEYHNRQGGLFSIKTERADCSTLGRSLYDNYDIQTRVGLHCSPLAHKFLKTYPCGTLRIAPSVFHTVNDFGILIKALNDVKKLL